MSVEITVSIANLLKIQISPGLVLARNADSCCKKIIRRMKSAATYESNAETSQCT